MEKSIKEKIMKLAGDALGVTLDDEPLKESGIDSLSLVTLILLIEEQFGITFNDDDLQPEKLLRLSDIVKITEKYL